MTSPYHQAKAWAAPTRHTGILVSSAWLALLAEEFPEKTFGSLKAFFGEDDRQLSLIDWRWRLSSSL
jgi:hypothetical protein